MLHLPRHPGERPVPSPETIAKVVARVKISEDWNGYFHLFDWNTHWRGLGPECFQDLTQEERVVLAYSDIFDSTLLRQILEEEPLLHRIRQSTFFYGREDWNTIVWAYEKALSFVFDEPGFTAVLDYIWTTVHGRGTSMSNRGRWLDGALAFFLHHEGELVAILGFSVCQKGLLIQQAQATHKRGGRGLFGQRSLLEVAVDKLARHFGGPVWIVDGKTQAEYLRRIEPKGVVLSTEDQARIAALYDRHIPGYLRTEETYVNGDFGGNGARTYHRLAKDPGTPA